MALLIKNAMIVNADSVSNQPQDILLEHKTIQKIGSSLSESGVKIIDAKGKLVLPGLIDLHAHLREPGYEEKETIETGSKAAAKGGFTTVLCMPNTNPVIDSAMVVEGIIKEAKRVGLINILPVGAITKGQKGEELCDMFELKQAGCVALSDDGKSVLNSQLLRHALEYAKMVDILIIEHCEDPYISAGGVMNESFTSTLLGLKGHAGMAESIIIARDIELARYLKTRIHFAHVSLKRSVDLIKFAKSEGIAVTAEVTPHHFSLTDEAVKTFDTNAKVNPPLRATEDVEALKKALLGGMIDCIATDHAPHAVEDKEVEFDHAAFGIIGLETAFGLAVTELVEAKILTLSQLVEKMSLAPARIIGLSNKGEIKEGKDADLIIVDKDREWVVREDDFASKSRNSPFTGRTLKGKVETTICNGKLVYGEK
ncbi:MAG: dihydroorotase [Candidatus Omnitrophota bacterium]